MWIFKHQYI